MRESNQLGVWGESLAAGYLREHGYEVLEANFRSRFGEIDLIARKGGYVAFVEVKLRRSDRYGRAAEQVDGRKQQRLMLAARSYLALHPQECPMRFDVVEVYAPQGRMDRRPQIIHWKAAF